MTALNALVRLTEALSSLGPVAVAASGGVDSMTLAVVAHRLFGKGVLIVHRKQNPKHHRC